jgi:hypothetical protein
VRKKCVSELAQRVEKSVTETLSLIIFVCDRVSVRYGKNVMDVDISECVTESVSVNSMNKSDGGDAAYAQQHTLPLSAQFYGLAM